MSYIVLCVEKEKSAYLFFTLVTLIMLHLLFFNFPSSLSLEYKIYLVEFFVKIYTFSEYMQYVYDTKTDAIIFPCA